MSDGSVPIEDFIHAITTQLDRVQDALRLKAINRPLTYALKDLAMELKVFVEVDTSGTVRFRTSGPNETGASVINLGFTTITKPMIEENTVSLASVKGASLSELGLNRDEQNRLERMGVTSVAQLNRLESSAGVKTIARLSDMPTDRLRAILLRTQPQVRAIVPDTPATPAAPATPVRRPPPPPVMAPHAPEGAHPSVDIPGPAERAPDRYGTQPALPPRIQIAPGTRRLNLFGQNLDSGAEPPVVLLNQERLPVHSISGEHIAVDLPDAFTSGALEVHLPDAAPQIFDVTRPDQAPDGCGDTGAAWWPTGG
ncbi:hypothetical protein WI40_13360 [Burkholderia ubonensis]|uniref:hypothetical protein n=1 Tax=Burkholderia ubonensis TaxID=101571 RepID=UPI00075F5A46|nr:hypothetical protein [Burkholderia ubonensis]KUZ98497.1 hypothetical protein WI40_13360 [Burkholderia ubonensis]